MKRFYSPPSTYRTSASKKQRLEPWHRRPALSLDPATDSLLFQQTSIEWQMCEDQRPVIHVYGVTEGGNSVLCHVRGFLPYAYFSVPTWFGEEDQDLSRFEKLLSERLGEDRVVIKSCEMVRRRNLFGYNDFSKFVKVTMTNPYKLRELDNVARQYSIEVFESNLDFVLRFMIDANIVGMSWIEMPAGTYKNQPQGSSQCQYEVEVDYDRIVSHAPEGPYSTIAPLRILSFDIECTGFSHEDDHVFQIANVVMVQGKNKPCKKVVFVLKGCLDIEGADIRSFYDEEALLLAWRDFVVEVDPDVFTGYKVNGFDFPFLVGRAEILGLKEFPYFGRYETRCRVTDKTTTTKAYGTRDTKVVNISGRVVLDMLEIIRRNYTLRSYTLKFVSKHFLDDEEKIDLPYKEMFRLQREGSDNDRRRIAEYCLKDAELPLLLMDKLMSIPNYVEMARVTGVPLSFLLTRGQQIKVLSKIYRAANAKGYVIPVIAQTEDNESGYEGATVIEPVKGFYDIPISTLDFNSLYPSIMMAHNLCYTTLLDRGTIKRLHLIRDDDYHVTPSGDAFLLPTKRQGLLPGILQDLIAARKRAKADLKKETDPFRRAVLDGRQLALKVVANSVYGFTGALKGYLPCQQIAASVTAFGRDMINETQRLVEERYAKKNGYEHDAEVIYGDTDSVMIKFGYTDLAKVMELSKDAAKYVTGHFKRPINLEFEKAYFPYLLIGKKRYAGLYWTNSIKHDKVDIKGIDIVRRDRCGLVQDTMRQCLDAILVNRDVNKAIGIVHQTLSDLLRGRVDLALLTFTGGWGKSTYTSDPPHVAVAKKMMLRDLNVTFGPGDRLAYVVTAGVKGSKVGDRAEDPVYVRAKNLPIDVEYYLSQLKRPLIDIFGPIRGGNKEASKVLFTGKHMNHIVKPIPILPTAFAGFTVTPRCKECKSPLKNGVCVAFDLHRIEILSDINI